MSWMERISEDNLSVICADSERARIELDMVTYDSFQIVVVPGWAERRRLMAKEGRKLVVLPRHWLCNTMKGLKVLII
jgi:hypothetical protein